MPWTIEDVDRFKSGLSDQQKRQWVNVANSVLERCLSNGGSQEGCERQAIMQANGVTGNMQTHSFQANVRNGVRRERFDGRDHLVVPVVALREGVLNGFYVPRDEIRRSAAAWNGVPLPVHHPMQNGRPVTANSPQQLEQRNLGRLFNVRAEGDKLKGEMYVDIPRAEQLGHSNIVQTLEQGGQLEVSTAYFSEDDFVQGNHSGRQYQAISRNLRPDHLALLPNETGACSWEDGCGAPRTHQANGEEDMTQEETATLNGNEAGAESAQDENKVGFVQKVLHALGLKGNQDGPGYEQIVDTIRMTVDSWDSEFAIHFLVEVFDDSFVYRKRDRQTNQSRLLRRGYTVDENGSITISDEEPQEVSQEISYVTIANNVEAHSMSKEQMVDKLIANEATQFAKEDRDTLMAMDECTLKRLEPVPQEPKGNAAESGSGEGAATSQGQAQPEGETITINKADLQKTVDEMVQNRLDEGEKDRVIQRLKQHEKCEWEEADLKAMSLDGLKRLESHLLPADYSGRGGPQANRSGQEEGPPPMPELFPKNNENQAQEE